MERLRQKFLVHEYELQSGSLLAKRVSRAQELSRREIPDLAWARNGSGSPVWHNSLTGEYFLKEKGHLCYWQDNCAVVLVDGEPLRACISLESGLVGQWTWGQNGVKDRPERLLIADFKPIIFTDTDPQDASVLNVAVCDEEGELRCEYKLPRNGSEQMSTEETLWQLFTPFEQESPGTN